MRSPAWLLVGALLAGIGRADTRGPSNGPGPVRTTHSAAATLGSDGKPDSWFVVRPGAAHDPLPAEGNVAAVLTLPDGRVFEADFSKAKSLVLEESAHERTTLRWSMFARAGEAKKIFGAHLFSTSRADGLVEYSCVFSNGACKPGVNGSFAGAFYFTDLRIELRERGRKLYADLRAGEALTNDGRTFVVVQGVGSWVPPRAQFTRRAFSYRRTGLLQTSQQREARAALDLSDLVLPASLNAWGTQKIPRRSEPSTIAWKHAALRSALSLGTTDGAVYRVHPRMGPFAGLFDDQAGEVGGAGILPVAAPELSLAAARWHRLAGDCVSERMPIAAYDADTGAPLTPEAWARGGASQGFEYRSTRGWDGIVQIPEFAAISSDWSTGVQRYRFREFNTGTCAWKDAITEFVPIDGAHLSRASKDDQAAWQLAHYWPAWLRSRMLAADVSCVQSLRGKRPLVAEYAGQWIPYSLERAIRDAKAAPGHGGGILRELGWSMDALAWGGMLPDPLAQVRNEFVATGRGMLELARASVLPNGIATDGHFEWGSDNQIAYNDYGLDHKYGEAPNFQVALYDNGIFSLTQLVGPKDPLSVDTANRTIVKACERFFTVPFVTGEYDARQFGPPWYLVTTENFAPCVPITKGVGKAHVIHDHHDLALAYLASGNRRYLEVMAHVGFPVESIETRLNGWRAQTRDREWCVLPQAVLESVVPK